jgi:hypothetical protein
LALRIARALVEFVKHALHLLICFANGEHALRLVQLGQVLLENLAVLLLLKILGVVLFRGNRVREVIQNSVLVLHLLGS